MIERIIFTLVSFLLFAYEKKRYNIFSFIAISGNRYINESN